MVVVVVMALVVVLVVTTSSRSTFLNIPLVAPFLTVIVIVKILPEESDLITSPVTVVVFFALLQVALHFLSCTAEPWYSITREHLIFPFPLPIVTPVTSSVSYRGWYGFNRQVYEQCYHINLG